MNVKKAVLLPGMIALIILSAFSQSQLNTPVTPSVTPSYTSTPNPNYLNPAVAPDPVIQRTNTDGSPVSNPAPATLTQPAAVPATQPAVITTTQPAAPPPPEMKIESSPLSALLF